MHPNHNLSLRILASVSFLLFSAKTLGETATPAETQAHVARAQFTSGIEQREPIDMVETLETDARRVYYFTELKNLQGQTVTHRWEFNGSTMAEVTLDVGGERWRTNSSKNLMPEWQGEWKVVVTDETGQVLEESTFQYVAANQPQ